MKFTQPAAFSATIKTDVLAVCVSADDPTGLPPELDQAFDGTLSKTLAEEHFTGRPGSVLAVRSLGRIPATWVLAVGVGNWSASEHRLAAGAASNFARDKGAKTLAFATPASGIPGERDGALLRSVVEGTIAGNYRWDRYKGIDERKPPLATVKLMGLHRHRQALKVAVAHGQAQSLARDLVNASAEDIYPESLADEARKLASRQLKVRVWDEKKILSRQMGGIHAVGKGSSRPPRFVHMTYTPSGTPQARLAIIGKGVTFDAGGLSIKPSSGMQTMRCDMGGAATVLGVMSALDEIAPNVQVEGIFGAAENMLGGSAYKLGDVLTMYNGKTVEIHNTDAEGRLLLADCLSYASELGVDACIDLATLTGAAVVALGSHYTALFTKDDEFADTWKKRAEEAGEGIWRLPLEELYKDKLKADWGTLKNVGGREAGSITAALFLSEFVDGPTWAHLDIAGPAFLDSPEQYLVKGGTGAMVRTVLRWLEEY
ncbi:MAG: leucyl aminopeptidase [Myxococcota bacterium]|nr:leucyl aminopeptidase [Myxococcota bacterium]